VRRLLAISLLGMAAASGIAGCGDDEQLTKPDFLTEADRVCRQSQAKFNRIQRKPARSAAQAEEQTGALIDVLQEALDDLEQLEPPDRLSPAFDRYLAARERAIGYLEQGRRAAESNDPEAYAAAKEKVTAEQAERLELARRVGLRECSRPPVTLGGR
jgi:hypothetical protein